MGSGFAKKKKQARQLQQQFLKMQEELKSVEIEGSAGNGLVTVKMNGEQELLSLKIKPECVDPEDIEGLEDLIVAAFKDAHSKAMDTKTPSGLPQIPGMPDLGALGL